MVMLYIFKKNNKEKSERAGYREALQRSFEVLKYMIGNICCFFVSCSSKSDQKLKMI